MPRRRPPEIAFQDHIAAFLIREHRYGVLEQDEITDADHVIAEDHLWAFLNDTQPDTVRKLADDYGTDARDEVFRALHVELTRTPLWLLIRQGLKVRGLEFRLYYPKPRSSESVAAKQYDKNRITFRPHCYFGETNQEIDFVFFLNGPPIVALEVKHEKNQNVHDAVAQYGRRDHTRKIFQCPFLYIAADTADVMAATDPRREENFRWHDSGLTNTPQTDGEYPVEFLYREVLSKDQLLEALAFFLVYVPKRDAEADRPERPAFTLFPEVMLRTFEENVKRLIAGRAKAMIVTSSRVAGLRYFQIIKEKLHATILAAGVFTPEDATNVVKLLAAGNDAQVQYTVSGLRNRFLERIADPEQRKEFVPG